MNYRQMAKIRASGVVQLANPNDDYYCQELFEVPSHIGSQIYDAALPDDSSNNAVVVDALEEYSIRVSYPCQVWRWYDGAWWAAGHIQANTVMLCVNTTKSKYLYQPEESDVMWQAEVGYYGTGVSKTTRYVPS